ncbi:MAG: hypothetical protein FWE67_13890 [Planctomycetaceae bacterium]|nr:hypothetical protein [Planctomycetaceae bacterium]
MRPHFSIKRDYSDFEDIRVHEPDIESIIREAAFISSEGKAYRLFSEDDNSDLGSHITLSASPFVKETADDCRQIDFPSASAREELSRMVLPSKKISKEEEECLPLTETFKKMRAVEGICGHNQRTVSSSLFLLPQEQNGQTSLPLKHVSEKKPFAIPLTQFIPADTVIPFSVPIDLPEPASELTAGEPEKIDTPKIMQEIRGNTKEKTVIRLTFIKLPATLHSRYVSIPFRKRKPAEIVQHTQPKQEQKCEIPVPQTADENIVKIATEKIDEKHHLPAHHQSSEYAENQIAVACHAAGEVFRTDAAAVWSSRVNSLEERALVQIKKLAVHILELHKQGKRIISFNSFFSGEGCTTVAACVARELSAQGYYVLLADTNERHAELTSQFSPLIDPEIYGIIPLEEKLHFLPFSDAMIESEVDGTTTAFNFMQLIGTLKNDYDFILLDNGCLSEHRLEERVKHWNDMNSDGVLLILKEENLSRINVNAVSERLREHRIALAGVAENYVPAA